jgi:hypothetical protein
MSDYSPFNVDQNPILKEPDIPHMLKILVLKECEFLMKNNHVNDVRALQTIVIDAWRNNRDLEQVGYSSYIITKMNQIFAEERNRRNLFTSVNNRDTIVFDHPPRIDFVNGLFMSVDNYCDYNFTYRLNEYDQMIDHILTTLKIEGYKDKNLKEKMVAIYENIYLLLDVVNNK